MVIIVIRIIIIIFIIVIIIIRIEMLIVIAQWGFEDASQRAGITEAGRAT